MARQACEPNVVGRRLIRLIAPLKSQVVCVLEAAGLAAAGAAKFGGRATALGGTQAILRWGRHSGPPARRDTR
jgi:hypothetical protein